jgi:hypothetical protein
VDLAAMAAVVVLTALGKIDAGWCVGLVAVLAGVRVKDIFGGGPGDGPGGSGGARLGGLAGLAVALGTGAAHTLSSVHVRAALAGLAIATAALGCSGCSAAQHVAHVTVVAGGSAVAELHAAHQRTYIHGRPTRSGRTSAPATPAWTSTTGWSPRSTEGVRSARRGHPGGGLGPVRRRGPDRREPARGARRTTARPPAPSWTPSGGPWRPCPTATSWTQSKSRPPSWTPSGAWRSSPGARAPAPCSCQTPRHPAAGDGGASHDP